MVTEMAVIVLLELDLSVLWSTNGLFVVDKEPLVVAIVGFVVGGKGAFVVNVTSFIVKIKTTKLGAKARRQAKERASKEVDTKQNRDGRTEGWMDKQAKQRDTYPYGFKFKQNTVFFMMFITSTFDFQP